MRLLPCFLAGLMLSAGTPDMSYARDPSVSSAIEAAVQEEDARFDENLETKELRDFRALLLDSKSTLQAPELEGLRMQVGFKRDVYGRVFLANREGKWFMIKPDMQASGFQLLRAETGECFYLPPDEAGRLMQIDLSDDLVVAELFSNGAWQDVMELLEVETNEGKVVQLKLELEEFKNVISLLEDAEDSPNAELQ